MKYSHLTYYLLAILFMMATSCVSDGVMGDCPIDNNDQAVLIEGGKVNFALTFPTSSTRGINGSSEGLASERTINDVQVYTFVGGKFVEKVKYILISGTNGDATRFVEGKLTETYMTGTAMDFVVMVNTESKGVQSPTMTKGNSKADLYKQLVYSYEGKNWSTNIPMWGEGTIASIQSGEYNIGELTLQRAIAKVNVTVNDGKGLENFEITNVSLHNYNNGGYCAPTNANGQPSIPTNVVKATTPLSAGSLSGTQGNNIENKFYIPEHKNIGVDKAEQLYLKIEAKVKGQIKYYDIMFSENGSDYDVLRNYMYVFNITNVKVEVDVNPILEYEVKIWEEKTVNIPSFN